MKTKNTQYIKMLLLFVLYTCFNQVNADGSLCEKEYFRLLENPNCQEEIPKWGTLKDKCELEGEYKYYLGGLYLFCKKENKAREMYKSAILKKDSEIFVKNSERMLVAIDLIDKNYTKVEKEAKQLIKKYPNWYSGYLYLGISAVFLENDYLKAKQYIDKSIEFEETWEGRCWQAIVEYHQFKNYEKTLELYERAMQLNMVSILEDAAASAAVSAAMKLGKWDSARWILNAQKTASQKVGNNIGDYQNYQKLRAIMDAYDKEHAPQH